MQRIAYRSERTAVASPEVTERSLSQKLVESHALLNRLPESIELLYDRLFILHFGRQSMRRNTPRNVSALSRIATWCAQHRVNVADYISANFILLSTRGVNTFKKTKPTDDETPEPSKRPKGKKRWRVRIVPAWLSGPTAERRYNGVLGRANRRFQVGSISAFTNETWIGRLRENLFYAESGAGELFVSLRLAGDPITWAQAVELTKPSNPDWADFQHRVGCFSVMANLLGEQRATAEARFAALRAAWSVAERVQPGLADRIGFTEFSWSAFADVLAYATESRRARTACADVFVDGGRTWGNWG